MYLRISLLCAAALALLSQAASASGSNACSDQAFSQDLAGIKDWKGLRQLYRQYVEVCLDDGFYAEGYSGAVVGVLTKNWPDLKNLQSLTTVDEQFRMFVLKHVDSTADPDELNQILRNTRTNCPAGLKELCHAIEVRAVVAIAGQ